MLMKPTRGTTHKARVSPAIFFKPSTPVSRRSEASRKLTSLSTARCDGHSFGDSRTPCSSRSAGRRSLSTPFSMALGTRKIGDAGETHDKPLHRTG
jgi:hypothetical protein